MLKAAFKKKNRTQIYADKADLKTDLNPVFDEMIFPQLVFYHSCLHEPTVSDQREII